MMYNLSEVYEMKLNIAVLFGAKACEHEISIVTATQLMENIDRNKYNVVPVYITKENQFYTGDYLLNPANYKQLNLLKQKSKQVNFIKDNVKVYLQEIGIFAKKHPIDVALLATHGGVGEDGSLQGFLEILDLPYTSSDVLSSAIAQDKIAQKMLFQTHQIPTVDGYGLDTLHFKENKAIYMQYNDELGYPVILKPNKLGSSIGIEIANDAEEFIEKVEQAAQFDLKILVEKKLSNFKELNCSVLGTLLKQEASPIEEVYKLEGSEFLDLGGKYLSGSKGKTGKTAALKTGSKGQGMASASRKLPADIPSDLTAKIQDYACKAYRAIGANGVVRIDFMYLEDTQEVFLNEINNIPGSMAFYLWEATGKSYPQLIDQLIQNALESYRLKASKTTVFDTNILSRF